MDYWNDKQFISRFRSKLDMESVPGCHIWTGSKMNGYGQVRTPGPVRMRRAHSVALEIRLGRRLRFDARMDRMQANHRDELCQRKDCCNADHLYEGTQRQNMDDARRLGRGGAAASARKTTCPRGHPYDMTTSNGGRACKTCHLAAMHRSGDRALAGELLTGRGRPRLTTCTHGSDFLVRRKNGLVRCRRCEADRKKHLRLVKSCKTSPQTP